MGERKNFRPPAAGLHFLANRSYRVSCSGLFVRTSKEVPRSSCAIGVAWVHIG